MRCRLLDKHTSLSPIAIAWHKSVLDLIGQLCSGSRHRVLGVSFMCLEMVLRRRRLYDLVIDPATDVDATGRELTYIQDRGQPILDGS